MRTRLASQTPSCRLPPISSEKWWNPLIKITCLLRLSLYILETWQSGQIGKIYNGLPQLSARDDCKGNSSTFLEERCGLAGHWSTLRNLYFWYESESPTPKGFLFKKRIQQCHPFLKDSGLSTFQKLVHRSRAPEWISLVIYLPNKNTFVTRSDHKVDKRVNFQSKFRFQAKEVEELFLNRSANLNWYRDCAGGPWHRLELIWLVLWCTSFLLRKALFLVSTSSAMRYKCAYAFPSKLYRFGVNLTLFIWRPVALPC